MRVLHCFRQDKTRKEQRRINNQARKETSRERPKERATNQDKNKKINRCFCCLFSQYCRFYNLLLYTYTTF